MEEKRLIFSARSERALLGVHPDLVAIVRRALEIADSMGWTDITVAEGRRSMARQLILHAAGKSQTLRSLHLTGHAIDVWPYPLPPGLARWDARNFAWRQVARAMKMAAAELGIKDLQNGIDLWGWDAPHWQLGRNKK